MSIALSSHKDALEAQLGLVNTQLEKVKLKQKLRTLTKSRSALQAAASKSGSMSARQLAPVKSARQLPLDHSTKLLLRKIREQKRNTLKGAEKPQKGFLAHMQPHVCKGAQRTAQNETQLKRNCFHPRKIVPNRKRDPSRYHFDKDASVYKKQTSEPSKAGVFKVKTVPYQHVHSFPVRYQRGELPFNIAHNSGGNMVQWNIDEDKIDIERLLPIFFNGIRNYDKPGEPAYRDLARQGVLKLCKAARNRAGFSLVPHIPRMIPPLREALNTRDPAIVAIACRSIQAVCRSDVNSGRALIPFYRQILPILNIFTYNRMNIGDGIDYGQRLADSSIKRTLDSHGFDSGHDIAQVVQETLEVMERTGGPQAFNYLKTNIPAYESCVHVVPCAPVPQAQAKQAFEQMDRGP
jgi:hypothetical protein